MRIVPVFLFALIMFVTFGVSNGENYNLPYDGGRYYGVSCEAGDTSQGCEAHAATGADPEAVDFRTPGDTVLRASESGIATISEGWNGGYGNRVTLAHENGEETEYNHVGTCADELVDGCHSSNDDFIGGFLVSNNEYVFRGEKIADSGNTGNSDGPHLHFVRRDDAGNSIIITPISDIVDLRSNWGIEDTGPIYLSDNYLRDLVDGETRFSFPNHSNQGWNPSNDAQSYVHQADVNTIGVDVTGSNPGFVGPGYSRNILGRNVVVWFSAKVIGNGDPQNDGKVWIKDETGSWNNEVDITWVNFEGTARIYNPNEYNVYQADFSNVRENLFVRQLSLELSEGTDVIGSKWVIDWIKVFERPYRFVFAGHNAAGWTCGFDTEAYTDTESPDSFSARVIAPPAEGNIGTGK